MMPLTLPFGLPFAPDFALFRGGHVGCDFCCWAFPSFLQPFLPVLAPCQPLFLPFAGLMADIACWICCIYCFNAAHGTDGTGALLFMFIMCDMNDVVVTVRIGGSDVVSVRRVHNVPSTY